MVERLQVLFLQKQTFFFLGDDPGSKYKNALSLNISILNYYDFEKL